MQVAKIGSALQTFAVASRNESCRRRASNRKTREERKALIESFITQYRSLNNGSYPSLRLTHREVGGSFYIVRDVLREIKQETQNSSLSFLPVEEQAIHNRPIDCTMRSLQAEGLNLATLSSTSDCPIWQVQGSFVQSSNDVRTAEYCLTTATGKLQGEDVEKVKSCTQEISLSDSEGNISISSIEVANCNKEESLCGGALGEDMIDEANKKITGMEQKEQEQEKTSVEDTQSFSPVGEGRLEEGMTLASSVGSLDPTFYFHNHLCNVEVEKNCEFLQKGDDLLNYGIEYQLMGNPLKEVKTVESSFICEQLENSCLAESKATDVMMKRDRANNHNENGIILSDCDANSTISYRKPEAAHVVNALTGKNDGLSGQAIQRHLSLISVTLSADFSDCDFLEMDESLKQNGTSGPANTSVEGNINSDEIISSPSIHKKENPGLEDVTGVNSDPCFMLTSGNGSMAPQENNSLEICDSPVVSSHNDDLSAQEVDLHEFVPVSELETKQKSKPEEVKRVVGGTGVYYIASAGRFQSADVDASRAEAGAMIASTLNSISSNGPFPPTRVLSSLGQRTVNSARKDKEYEWTQSIRLSRSVLYTHGNFPMKREELNITRRPETNSCFVIIKALVGALFQILNTVMQVFTVGSKTKT